MEDVIVSVIRKKRSPVAFQDLKARILKGKLFKTKSGNFDNVLRRTLYQQDGQEGGQGNLRRGLTGRPQQGAAAEKVEMQMAHRLPTVLPAVDDESVASAVQSLGRCDAGRGENEFPGQIAVGIL